jgi:hypothetical protein
MAKTSLVSPDIELGSEVIGLLDDAGFPLTVALWVLGGEDEGEWELIVGTPLYDKVGPKESYRRLLAALASMDPNALHQLPIRILGHKNPLIRGLRRIFGKTASVEGMRLGGHALGGSVWIDDAYVYRVK